MKAGAAGHDHLHRRIEQAEAVIEALREGHIDAIVGKENVALLRLAKTEKALRTRELMDDALSAARDGAALTQRLLAFSRKQPLQVHPVDINECLSGIRPLLRRTLRADIVVSIETDSDVPKVLVDRAQLENALLNLVINARDAMPHGGSLSIAAARTSVGTDELTTNSQFAPGHYVMITVSDSGIGMPPEVANSRAGSRSGTAGRKSCSQRASTRKTRVSVRGTAGISIC